MKLLTLLLFNRNAHFILNLNKFLREGGFQASNIKSHRFSSHKSTIFALTSGHGKCAVAVVRVSGSEANTVFTSMTKLKQTPPARKAILQTVVDNKTKIHLDKGLVIWFPGPNSFTGEDVCELHLHGSKAVIMAVLTSLSTLPHFRPAEAGEFTKRAFYNGKMDLTEVEGLADLLAADTEAQRKQALLQMEGIQSKLYNKWRQIVLQELAKVEAYIDFSEDENIEDHVIGVAKSNIRNIAMEMEMYLKDGRKGERLKDGVKTAILGKPNVGKSSLLNILCRRDVAIVTDQPGTTRDVLETTIDLFGYPVMLMDTAGIRKNTSDIVELEGIQRAIVTANKADLLLLMIDVLKYYEENENGIKLKEYIENYLDNLHLINNDSCKLYLINKIDLLNEKQIEEIQKETIALDNVVLMSCKNDDTLNSLMQPLKNHLHLLCGEPNELYPTCNHIRHRHNIDQCVSSLKNFFNDIEIESRVVFAAESLREASDYIGKITGHVAVDEVLDVIFKQFCIGK